MKKQLKLEVYTFGKCSFETLSDEEQNLICSSLLSTILELHKSKTIRRKQK